MYSHWNIGWYVCRYYLTKWGNQENISETIIHWAKYISYVSLLTNISNWNVSFLRYHKAIVVKEFHNIVIWKFSQIKNTIYKQGLYRLFWKLLKFLLNKCNFTHNFRLQNRCVYPDFIEKQVFSPQPYRHYVSIQKQTFNIEYQK